MKAMDLDPGEGFIAMKDEAAAKKRLAAETAAERNARGVPEQTTTAETVETRRHALDEFQREYVNDLKQDAAAAEVNWKKIAPPDGDVDRFLARFNNVEDGLVELTSRVDAAIERKSVQATLESRGLGGAPALEPGELSEVAGRPVGTTKKSGRKGAAARERLRRSGVKGEVAEAKRALRVTGGTLPEKGSMVFRGETAVELRERLASGELTLKEFAQRLPPEGLRDVHLPVPGERGPTTRKVDHLRMEGDKVVLGEVKDVKELRIETDQRIRQEFNGDLWLARREPDIIIEWTIKGGLSTEAENTLKLLEQETAKEGIVFRVVRRKRL
jgi:hypothetical protein